MMKRRYSTGITMIELMVVTVIIAILAGIGYPMYRQYAVRSNRTEAKTELLQLTQALEKCYTRFHVYDHDDCEVDADYVTASGNYEISSDIDPQAYTLEATPKGGQLEDDKCGVLSITNAGVKKERDGENLVAANKCW